MGENSLQGATRDLHLLLGFQVIWSASWASIATKSSSTDAASSAAAVTPTNAASRAFGSKKADVLLEQLG